MTARTVSYYLEAARNSLPSRDDPVVLQSAMAMRSTVYANLALVAAIERQTQVMIEIHNRGPNPGQGVLDNTPIPEDFGE